MSDNEYKALSLYYIVHIIIFGNLVLIKFYQEGSVAILNIFRHETVLPAILVGINFGLMIGYPMGKWKQRLSNE